MHLFYSTEAAQGRITLSGEEAFHCTRVLRLGRGDVVDVTDGKGHLYRARIESAGRDETIAIAEHTADVAPPRFHLHMAVAPTKNNDRFEWFLEKATEIGIGEITPVICDHSERDRVKQERMLKVVISAIKQSQKAWLPVIREATPFRSFVKGSSDKQRYIAWCGSGSEAELHAKYRAPGNVTILVGPEGDFSDEEILLARGLGWEPVSLGPERLRTETAALAACHTINLLNRMADGRNSTFKPISRSTIL